MHLMNGYVMFKKLIILITVDSEYDFVPVDLAITPINMGGMARNKHPTPAIRHRVVACLGFFTANTLWNNACKPYHVISTMKNNDEVSNKRNGFIFS